MTPLDRPLLAVLIDAENARAAHIAFVMEKVAELGRPAVCRAYGDWTTPQLTPWKKILEEFAIRPCQQFRHRKGKNSSDGTLIMDAMELLYLEKVDGFCIVSSDCDFTGLAGRIQERGPRVYGFGEHNTMRAFVAACDEFFHVGETPSQTPAHGVIHCP